VSTEGVLRRIAVSLITCVSRRLVELFSFPVRDMAVGVRGLIGHNPRFNSTTGKSLALKKKGTQERSALDRS
jgi:hypothetical protein